MKQHRKNVWFSLTRHRLELANQWLDSAKSWLDSKKILVTLTGKACDSDSTNMTRAHHWQKNGLIYNKNESLTVSATIYPISARNPCQMRRNQASEIFQERQEVIQYRYTSEALCSRFHHFTCKLLLAIYGIENNKWH